jgi:hypothetical protein
VLLIPGLIWGSPAVSVRFLTIGVVTPTWVKSGNGLVVGFGDLTGALRVRLVEGHILPVDRGIGD